MIHTFQSVLSYKELETPLLGNLEDMLIYFLTMSKAQIVAIRSGGFIKTWWILIMLEE